MHEQPPDITNLTNPTTMNLFFPFHAVLFYIFSPVAIVDTPTPDSAGAASGLGLRDYGSILAIIASISALVMGFLKWKSERDREVRTTIAEERSQAASSDVNAMQASYKVLEGHIKTLTAENTELRRRGDLSDVKIQKLEKQIREQDDEIRMLKRQLGKRAAPPDPGYPGPLPTPTDPPGES